MLRRQHETWFDDPGTAVAAIGIRISCFRPIAAAISVFLLPLVVACDDRLTAVPLVTAMGAVTGAPRSTNPL